MGINLKQKIVRGISLKDMPILEVFFFALLPTGLYREALITFELTVTQRWGKERKQSHE